MSPLPERAQAIRSAARFLVLAMLASSAGAAPFAAPLPSPAYPRFGTLGPEDVMYRQHQEQLAASYAALMGKGSAPEILIYEYLVASAVDIFSLAARLNLPYETLATLNRLDRSREFLPGERVLAPTMPGIFASESPRTDLEILLSYRASASGGGEPGRTVIVRARGGEMKLRFYPGERFSPEERALFLGLLFRFPLPSGVMTSGFGPRASPIDGKIAAHQGVDLAAPAGTDVYAAREGRVVESGIDPALGQYIALEHEGGWSTIYGHLSMRRVELNESVESGIIIGNVGSTGLSTGPHLHFEVRNRGEPRDPATLIPRGKR